MISLIGLTAIALTALVDGADTDFITRVEQTELLGSDGKPFPRVERDDESNVRFLRLSSMQLSADDFTAIGKIKTLRHLDLYKTNVTDADLAKLSALTQLEGLNVTSTEVTDAAIDEIMKLKSLRSLCLGSVAITPAAVARLKEHFRTQKRQLSLGYSQRK